MRRTPILFALLLSVTAALAQQDDGRGKPAPMPTPERGGNVTGIVSTVSGHLISVLNGIVTIDATGATFTARRDHATIADVKPGVQIVAAIRNPEAGPGTLLQASQVLILDTSDGTLNGPVQAVDLPANTITLLGTRIVVPSGVSGIKPGDVAFVQVDVAGGALVAESITIAPPLPNASFEGVVKSIGAASWLIGETTVLVTSQTKIDPSIKIGDTVLVIGNADAAGQITATAIYPARRPDPPDSDAALTGTVKSISATTWIIADRKGNDVPVTVNAVTKIDPAIVAGDAVSVYGSRDAAGNLVATAIVKSAPARKRSAQSA